MPAKDNLVIFGSTSKGKIDVSMTCNFDITNTKQYLLCKQ